MTDEEWNKFQQWHSGGASPKTAPDPSQSGGVMSSIGAGLKGAISEATGDMTPDPNHPTAQWVGRQVTDWGPLIALDAFGPEVPMAGAALRYAPRLATLAQKGLTGAYKGAIGGEWMQPKDRTRGEATGALTGASAGAARAGFSMLPWWAKAGALGGGLANVAGAANVAHELSGNRGGYISPWSIHHAISALAALAGAAAGMPATTGGAASKIQEELEPEANKP